MYKHRIGFLDALSSNRIVIIGEPSSGGPNQQLHFGSPVKADHTVSDDFMSLTTIQPPRDLAEGAEVIVISAYEPSLYKFYKPKPWKLIHLSWDPTANIEVLMNKRREDRSYYA